MQSPKITHSAHVLCSFVLVYILNKTSMVDARLVWIPRINNEKDISINVNDSPFGNSKTDQVIVLKF